ncbi:MAG: dihydroorotate dehydrogenase electron transfer subunit [Deltaproteobacteria bacterium]|nr:dihydroorotate dehydrogenase electron transfer subunit [Deltaproteobacteria bacterium]
MHETVATVVENRDLGSGVHLLRLRNREVCAEQRAGRFVMLGVGETVEGNPPAPMLRRPFSIQRVEGDVFDVLYRVVGVGTTCMAAMKRGRVVEVLGPLGNAFTPPAPGEQAILLGGGVGIPPMVAMADALSANNADWKAFLGVSSTADAGCFVGFDDRPSWDSRVHRATMDGSLGFHGHVVQAWLADREANPSVTKKRVYACGPMVMLRAVAKVAASLNIPAEVSVETMMGCGIGICMGCVIENKRFTEGSVEDRSTMSPYDRWLMACTKGPVFDAQGIVLDDGGLLH